MNLEAVVLPDVQIGRSAERIAGGHGGIRTLSFNYSRIQKSRTVITKKQRFLRRKQSSKGGRSLALNFAVETPRHVCTICILGYGDLPLGDECTPSKTSSRIANSFAFVKVHLGNP